MNYIPVFIPRQQNLNRSTEAILFKSMDVCGSLGFAWFPPIILQADIFLSEA